MTKTEQWEQGYRAGVNAARILLPQALKRAVEDARYDTPYCKGFRYGVADVGEKTTKS